MKIFLVIFCAISNLIFVTDAVFPFAFAGRLSNQIRNHRSHSSGDLTVDGSHQQQQQQQQSFLITPQSNLWAIHQRQNRQRALLDRAASFGHLPVLEEVEPEFGSRLRRSRSSTGSLARVIGEDFDLNRPSVPAPVRRHSHTSGSTSLNTACHPSIATIRNRLSLEEESLTAPDLVVMINELLDCEKKLRTDEFYGLFADLLIFAFQRQFFVSSQESQEFLVLLDEQLLIEVYERLLIEPNMRFTVGDHRQRQSVMYLRAVYQYSLLSEGLGDDLSLALTKATIYRFKETYAYDDLAEFTSELVVSSPWELPQIADDFLLVTALHELTRIFYQIEQTSKLQESIKFYRSLLKFHISWTLLPWEHNERQLWWHLRRSSGDFQLVPVTSELVRFQKNNLDDESRWINPEIPITDAMESLSYISRVNDFVALVEYP